VVTGAVDGTINVSSSVNHMMRSLVDCEGDDVRQEVSGAVASAIHIAVTNAISVVADDKEPW
jgi:hypothetical protein